MSMILEGQILDRLHHPQFGLVTRTKPYNRKLFENMICHKAGPNHPHYALGEKRCSNCGVFLITTLVKCPKCHTTLKTKPIIGRPEQRASREKYFPVVRY